MKTREVKARLYGMLNARQVGCRSWDRDAIQQAIEPTCLTILALRHDWTTELEVAVRGIVASQNSDGSFPVFIGDESEGCWTTGLAVLSLLAIGREIARLQPAIRWILDAKGREANWFWRWKFQTIDHSVQFDPAKYGWSWVPDTTSWVIPTAFNLIALRQTKERGLNTTPELTERIEFESAGARGAPADRVGDRHCRADLAYE